MLILNQYFNQNPLNQVTYRNNPITFNDNNT